MGPLVGAWRRFQVAVDLLALVTAIAGVNAKLSPRLLDVSRGRAAAEWRGGVGTRVSAQPRRSRRRRTLSPWPHMSSASQISIVGGPTILVPSSESTRW